MEISATLVKELREKTGVGMMECKKALTEAKGDIAKATDILRERGIALADKKAGRIATEGLVESYIHGQGRIGVLVEVNCETDFVTKTDEFKIFVKDVAMHIAASNPLYLNRDEVPEDVIQKERDILRQQAINEGKPVQIIDKMVEGRVEKFFKEVCLLEQPFIKDPNLTVESLLKEKIAKIGENMNIRRFARFQLGEGLEKKVCNFAEEVQAQTKL